MANETKCGAVRELESWELGLAGGAGHRLLGPPALPPPRIIDVKLPSHLERLLRVLREAYRPSLDF